MGCAGLYSIYNLLPKYIGELRNINAALLFLRNVILYPKLKIKIHLKKSYAHSNDLFVEIG